MLRNLTPTIDTSTADKPQPWRITDLSDRGCFFCGASRVVATFGCPAPTGQQAILNVGVCNNCLIDSIMARFSKVFCERMYKFGIEMNDAAREIVDLRRLASAENSTRTTCPPGNSRSARGTACRTDAE